MVGPTGIRSEIKDPEIASFLNDPQPGLSFQTLSKKKKFLNEAKNYFSFFKIMQKVRNSGCGYLPGLFSPVTPLKKVYKS